MNGADRVQRLGEVTVQGMTRRVECGAEVRSLAQRRDAAADEIGGRGVFGQLRQGICVRAEARAEAEDRRSGSCSAPVWLRW